MEKKYQEIMKILKINEVENEAKLIENIQKTLEIITDLNDADVDVNLEPLNYVHENKVLKLRDETKNYNNNENIQTNENKFFVVRK